MAMLIRRCQRRLSKVVAVFVLIAIASPLSATLPYHKSFSELIHDSAVIAVGRVIGISLEKEMRGGMPYTMVRFDTTHIVLGREHLATGDSLNLLFAGGLLDDGSFVEVIGVPNLRLGSVYLLFLKSGQWNLNPVSGWDKGIFEVVRESRDGPDYLLDAQDRILTGISDDQFVFHSLIRHESGGSEDEPAGGAVFRVLGDEERERLVARLRAEGLPEDVKQGPKEDEDPSIAGIPRMAQVIGVKPMELRQFLGIIAETIESMGDRGESKFYLTPAPKVSGGDN